MAVLVKTLNGLAYASVKTRNGLAVASMKTINGLDVTSGGSFSPSDIAGLQVWLKADAITGLVDGDPVASWIDSSGNGWTGTASGTDRPTYKTAVMNGQPAVLFSRASSQWLYCGSGPNLTNWSIFAVIKIGSTSDYGIIALKGSSSSRNFGIYSNPSSYDVSHTFTVGGSFNGSSATASAAATVMTAGYSGSADAVYINGTSGGGGSMSGTADSTSDLGIGRYGSSSANYFDGHIAEVIIYNSYLSLGNREAVENYLGPKYGITIAH